MKNAFLGKAASLFAPGISVSEKFVFIDGEKDNYPLVKICAWLNVSKSGYYEWHDRPLSMAVKRRERLKLMITAVFDANHAWHLRVPTGACGARPLRRAAQRRARGVTIQPALTAYGENELAIDTALGEYGLDYVWVASRRCLVCVGSACFPWR